MKRMYFIMAFFGCVIPYYFFIRFLSRYGLDIQKIGDQLFATNISTFFALDLIIVAMVTLLFFRFDARRAGMKRWWVYGLATLLIGPSFSIPLYLGVRQDYL